RAVGGGRGATAPPGGDVWRGDPPSEPLGGPWDRDRGGLPLRLCGGHRGLADPYDPQRDGRAPGPSDRGDAAIGIWRRALHLDACLDARWRHAVAPPRISPGGGFPGPAIALLDR